MSERGQMKTQHVKIYEYRQKEVLCDSVLKMEIRHTDYFSEKGNNIA